MLRRQLSLRIESASLDLAAADDFQLAGCSMRRREQSNATPNSKLVVLRQQACAQLQSDVDVDGGRDMA
jgi:hypothetical protein